MIFLWHYLSCREHARLIRCKQFRDHSAKDHVRRCGVAPGTKKVWEDALASEVYVDESSGRSQSVSRSTHSFAGRRLMESPTTRRMSPATSTAIHISDNEQETFHGQNLTAQYLTARNLATRRRRMEAVLDPYLCGAEGPAGRLPCPRRSCGRMSANTVPLPT